MSTGFQENGQDGDTTQFASATAIANGAPTQTLVASAVGDRCVNCGAMVLSDQRYCVVCGERRGAPRFTLPAASAAAEPPSTVSVRRNRSRGPRFGSGVTLIAGVGTLLLALLVGFLIGNAATKANTKTVTTSPPVKIINEGSGSTGSASAGTSTAASSKSATKTSSHSHKPKQAAATSKKVVKSESNAASKVTGGNGTPPASTKVGQKCSGSACNKPGYNKKSHKFDGSFFGQ